jgi:excisionase family DNA binding protein
VATTEAEAARVLISVRPVVPNPSRDSDWGKAVTEFVQRAARVGKAVAVSVDKPMLSPGRAAELADVSRATIQRRIDDGTIKAARRGSHWCIPTSELNRYRQAMADEFMVSAADELEL